MFVSLSEDTSVSMFFVGEPKNLVLSLTFANPGPVEIDLEKLDKPYQVKILNAIKDGILSSDIPFQELYQSFTKSPVVQPKEVKAEEVPAAVQEVKPSPPPAPPSQAEQRMALEVERMEKEKQLNERCDFILKGSIKAVKAALAGEEDVRLVRSLINKEQSGKQRSVVLKFLREKLCHLEEKVAKQITRDTEKQLSSFEREKREQTPVFSVIESEQKTIILTPEDLVRRTISKTL